MISIKSSKLKIVVPLVGVIFSLASVFTGTFAWFTTLSTVTASSMSIKLYADNTKITCSGYKYNIAQSEVMSLDESNAMNFALNQYDMVFTELNKYDPLYIQLTLTGTSLETSGTFNIVLERDIEKNVMDEDNHLSSYFTSITKYAAKGNSAYTNGIYVSGNSSQTWNHLQTVFHDEDVSGNLITSKFTTITTSGYEKTNTITLPVSYTANDFVGNSLIIYLYINYDVTLVTNFVNEQGYDTTSIGGTINHPIENDLVSLGIIKQG